MSSNLKPYSSVLGDKCSPLIGQMFSQLLLHQGNVLKTCTIKNAICW